MRPPNPAVALFLLKQYAPTLTPQFDPLQSLRFAVLEPLFQLVLVHL
jgi:hypothetical protein